MSPATNKSIPHPRVIAINGSGGAIVTISADIFSPGYVEITECPPDGGAFTGSNFAPQGLVYTTSDDNYADSVGLVAGDTFVLGTPTGPNKSIGVGVRPQPGQADLAATIYGKFRSATVTATFVSVKEWPQR